MKVEVKEEIPEESTVGEAVTEYERRRQENIRRNEAILAELRRDAATVSAAYAPARRKRQPRTNPDGGGRRLPAPLRARASPAAILRLRWSLAPFGAPEGPTRPPPHLRGLRRRGGDGGGPVCAPHPRHTRRVLASAGGKASRRGGGARSLLLRGGDVVKARPVECEEADADGDDGGATGAPARGPYGGGRGDRFRTSHVLGRYQLVARSCRRDVLVPSTHTQAVSGITAHPSVPLKIYSCSRNGEIRLMDLEKEIFNMVHFCNDSVLSLCQSPDNRNCLYFGKGSGDLKAFDERAGKISSTWQLHRDSISSIDFNPQNTYMLATSSLDNTACLWDLRNMQMLKAQSLKVVEHNMHVHSAYFSPSGNTLATTSRDNTVGILSDNTVGILSVRDFNKSCYLQHSCPSTTFKASWGWDDSELFVGIERDIDILSVDLTDDKISISCKDRFTVST